MKWLCAAVAVLACACGDDDPGSVPVVDAAVAADAHTGSGADPNPDDEAAFLFDDTTLRTFELRLSPEDLAFLDESPVREEYVPGTMHFDGEVVSDVGIRYKGSAGAFLGCTAGTGFPPTGAKTCIKLSIKVNVDWHDTGARFHGLEKLQFHSMNKDESLLRERLGYWLFREMGIATSRTAPVRLLINGEFAGLFLLVEQIDGRFTRTRFADGGKGNLYKEVWPIHDEPSVYVDALRSNRNGTPSVERMLAFRDALAAADDASRPAVVEAWMDMAYMANYLAVDRAIANDDSIMHWYCNVPLGQGGNPGTCGNHNYYWYEEPGRERMWLVAWDVDLAFGNNALTALIQPWDEPARSCETDNLGPFSSLAPSCDPLIRAWATFEEPYRAAARALIDGPFSPEVVEAKLATWEAQMAPVVAEAHAHDPEHLSPQAWQAAIASFKAAIDQQREDLAAATR